MAVGHPYNVKYLALQVLCNKFLEVVDTVVSRTSDYTTIH